MYKVLIYSLLDLIRSRWSYIYLIFYLLLGFGLLFINNDLSKSIVTLMNIVIIITPMIGTIFGAMFYYNSIDFSRLLLGQPINRNKIFLGQFLGLSISLISSLVIGLGIPFLIYGIFKFNEVFDFFLIVLIGSVLTFIFSAISFIIAMLNEDKIKGIGISIIFWLFLAVIYDGLILIMLIYFKDYPLEKLAIFSSIFNPIDLSRTLIILKFDMSALLGYTGAVLQMFYGTYRGILLIFITLLFWIFIPIKLISIISSKKDF